MTAAKPAHLGFLVSHRGSNMQSIIDACKDGRLNAEAVAVISNNGDAAALERAENAGIPAYHIGGTNFPDEQERDRVIRDTLLRHKVDLVILAGYLKKIGPGTLRAFKGRMINIHPSLLPRYGGRGMYGMKIHQAVIAAGETETGVTIHLVDDAYDSGRVLAQRRVPVKSDDTAERLAERVLKVEHVFYVETLEKILSGEIPLLQ